ncbi:MAG TPA: P-loop NTPase fold protein [Nostocaceae cyanobacterium]|nr:P-loop NTPase fold protein [Nostocaceae cyanobacterium]
MSKNSESSIEAVDAAIKSYNPFTNAGIAKEQDVWGKGFPDVPALNSKASDTVLEAIELVSNSTSSQEKVTSIVITAPPGVGKTHILGRIRHKLQQDGKALFIYAGVNNYTDLNLVKYQFQQTLADSLSKTGSQGVMQWQEVAAAMVNESSSNNSLTPTELVNKFDRAYINSLAQNKNLMNFLQKQVLKNMSNVDPYILRAILWTLSETQSPFAIKWLSGEELAQSNADELSLPNPIKTNQDREAEALKNIQQILNLVSHYKPVVICFDEIDVKNNSTDDGLPTESVIANLVKILHDTLENSEIGKGVVIITVMLPETWRDKVNSMSGGTPDRISKYTQRKPLNLKQINGDSMLKLVKIWLNEFYSAKNLVPPHPLYPFDENQLKEYGNLSKPTVREALRWCADNFKIDDEPLPDDLLERFELAFNKENEADLGDYIEDNDLIAEALYFGFTTLKGQMLENVLIEEVTNDIKPKAYNRNSINFKILGSENGKQTKIGVSVIQTSQITLTAGLKRLLDYEKFDLTRGCLVREKSKVEKTKKNSEAYKLMEQLISQGGEIVDLIKEQIRPIIAILYVYKKGSYYKLPEEKIFDFISQKQITFNNPLLREILSDPSGNMPTVDDEDIDIGELFNSVSGSETEEEDIFNNPFGEV